MDTWASSNSLLLPALYYYEEIILNIVRHVCLSARPFVHQSVTYLPQLDKDGVGVIMMTVIMLTEGPSKWRSWQNQHCDRLNI